MKTIDSNTEAIFRTDLEVGTRRQGKVRDVYTLPAKSGHAPRVLIVATDRISAFDVVLPTPIPGKGRLLTDISVQWFALLERQGLIASHLLSTDPADIPSLTDEQRRSLEGRVMIGRAAQVIPVEFVVRGYLAGSGWIDYQRDRQVCGVALPADLQRCGKLPEPIFTPATKAEVGHDENIGYEQACAIAGREVIDRLRDVSLAIYDFGARHAEQRGIILADTKFEFGYALNADGQPTDELMLIDEVLTPDSSRFWPQEHYEPGREQESFDKQYVRNHLLELVDAGRWDKTAPGPQLPPTVVQNTLARYREARRLLFG